MLTLPRYSMGHIRLLEEVVDERISKTRLVFQSRFALTGERLNLSDWVRCVACFNKSCFYRLQSWCVARVFPLNLYRWHIYDTVTQMIYGEPIGMVEKGSDIDGLISQWHRVFPLGGLLATLPWLINPLITNRFLNRFLMPSKRQSIGSGHVMTVSETTSVCLFNVSKHRAEIAAIKPRCTRNSFNIALEILS